MHSIKEGTKKGLRLLESKQKYSGIHYRKAENLVLTKQNKTKQNTSLLFCIKLGQDEKVKSN